MNSGGVIVKMFCMATLHRTVLEVSLVTITTLTTLNEKIDVKLATSQLASH